MLRGAESNNRPLPSQSSKLTTALPRDSTTKGTTTTKDNEIIW